MSRLLKILRNVFALAGVVTIFVLVFIWFRERPGMPSDASVILSVPSPTGRFKAVAFHHHGGGAFAPFCFEFVYVVLANVPDQMAWNQSGLVLAGSCGALPDKTRAGITWTSDQELTITIDATAGARHIQMMSLKGSLMGGQVRMTFVQRSP